MRDQWTAPETVLLATVKQLRVQVRSILRIL